MHSSLTLFGNAPTKPLVDSVENTRSKADLGEQRWNQQIPIIESEKNDVYSRLTFAGPKTAKVAFARNQVTSCLVALFSARFFQ